MNPKVKSSLIEHSHDVRIDFARGIANWFIFLDHVPHNAVSLLTIRNFGFSGAADIFVFVTGYAAAIHFGKITMERGTLVAVNRILKRAGQLYAAYLVSFVIYIDTIGSVAAQYAAPDIMDEYNVSGIIDHPILTLMHGLTLQARPLNLDVLQLFIGLTIFFPLALVLLLRWPNLALIGSAALYAAARIFDFNIPSFPDGRWAFNPFCWQLLFVFGAWLALGGARHLRAIYHMPVLRILALAYLSFALLITLGGRIPEIGNLIPDFLLHPFTPNDKEHLAPHRLLHALALLFLLSRFAPKSWSGFRRVALQPILKCGEEWLACFCAGVFLSFAAHLVLITSPNSVAIQFLVSVAGIAAMTAVAYYVSWSKRQDRQRTIGAGA